MAKQKTSILTQPDYAEIRRVVREEVDELLKKRLANIPTQDQATADKVEILAAINDLKNEDKAHKKLHMNLGTEVPKLQQQVQHLFKTFEIEDPTEVAISI